MTRKASPRRFTTYPPGITKPRSTRIKGGVSTTPANHREGSGRRPGVVSSGAVVVEWFEVVVGLVLVGEVAFVVEPGVAQRVGAFVPGVAGGPGGPVGGERQGGWRG